MGLPMAGMAAAPASPPTILVVGDSLSAEYGLARGAGWVSLLEKRLAERDIAATVVNASISGDTTAGGRARLAPLLAKSRPDVVVIELGGNDALRGLPLAGTEDNLIAMVKAAQAIKAKVLLVGIQVPPNYGGDYMQKFSGVYETVAKKTGSAVTPFLLRGIADVPDAEANFQPDRIHPLASAHPRMLENVWPALAPLLKR
ncbi:arylesterase [Xylophilus sp. GOD-11R]|uniref:arylesterase n=1 Tax=Xylophilus sp. GOD-11R TaxID=3089814 RepID=UPI00298CD627|nr:arylesterase [Xylophilus sp. GOD-11R]WPB59424.1 arylesterase [Xylophilus sp. GOD-11R]